MLQFADLSHLLVLSSCCDGQYCRHYILTMDVFFHKSLEKQMLEHISSLFCLFYLSSVVMIIKYLQEGIFRLCRAVEVLVQVQA
jgi:hypothetical protein